VATARLANFSVRASDRKAKHRYPFLFEGRSLCVGAGGEEWKWGRWGGGGGARGEWGSRGERGRGGCKGGGRKERGEGAMRVRREDGRSEG
jgi:hypothetical protein